MVLVAVVVAPRCNEYCTHAAAWPVPAASGRAPAALERAGTLERCASCLFGRAGVGRWWRRDGETSGETTCQRADGRAPGRRGGAVAPVTCAVRSCNRPTALSCPRWLSGCPYPPVAATSARA